MEKDRLGTIVNTEYSGKNGRTNQACTDTEKSVRGNCFREGRDQPGYFVKGGKGRAFRFCRRLCRRPSCA